MMKSVLQGEQRPPGLRGPSHASGTYASGECLPAESAVITRDADVAHDVGLAPGSLEGVRVGVVRSMHAPRASAAAHAALHDACAFLVQHGACVEDVHVPDRLENFFEVAQVRWGVSLARVCTAAVPLRWDTCTCTGRPNGSRSQDSYITRYRECVGNM